MAKKGMSFTCPVCSKVFYRYPSQIVPGKETTCSRTCAARHFRDKGEYVDCPVCRKPFWRTAFEASKGHGNYCSHACWGSLRHVPKNQTWSPEQRNTWKDTACVRCGAAENLELDHIVPTSRGGKNERSNAQTLCKSCNIRKFQCEELPSYVSETQPAVS